MALAESQDLLGHLTGESINLNLSSIKEKDSTSTSTATKATTTSAEAIAWRKSDRLLRGWLIGTLSEEALSLVIGQDTAQHVWESLRDAYA